MPFWARRGRGEGVDAAADLLSDAEYALECGDPERALRLAGPAQRAAGGDAGLLLDIHSLRAEALSELDRFGDAERAASEAIALDPEAASPRHMRAITLTRLGRFEEAVAELRAVSRADPDDPLAWHDLGRCLVWTDQIKSATDAFRRAHHLEPSSFVVPVRIAAPEFDRIASDAYGSIPARFRSVLAGTIVAVEPLPALDDVEQGFDPDTLGVYEGSTVLGGGDLPERILLFQRNHENVCAGLGELRLEIRRTILHEVGHHFGMEEHELPY